ncbi:MAG: class I SAM-dependent methyltransferase [Rhodobacterales bacterium]
MMPSELDISAVKDFGDSVDFGKTASDYSTHRAGFPDAFFDFLAAQGYIKKGLNALDLGTGTGTVARGLALCGLHVTGIDPAATLLAEAAKLDRQAGVRIQYCQGRAENLEVADQSLDIVTAGQCWHWFERAKTASGVFRLLKPGGRLIIAHFDWLPLAGNVVEATEKLILKYNPAWALSGGAGIYPDWLADMAQAGFAKLQTHSFDIAQPYSPDGWCGRIRASAGIKASLNTNEIAAFDAELRILLKTDFPQDPLLIPHRVWLATGLRPNRQAPIPVAFSSVKRPRSSDGNR